MRYTGNDETQVATVTGQFLSADEVGKLAVLMQELRDLTQSRRTFAAANELLARLSTSVNDSSLVPHDILEY